MRTRLRQVAWVFSLAGAVTLSGCVVAPVDDGYADYGYTSTTVYTHYGDPPPVPVEYRTMAPSARHVWIDGDWIWGGSRYNWRPGYWATPGFRPAPPPQRPMVQPPRPYMQPAPRPRPPVVRPQARPEPRPQPPLMAPPSGQRPPAQLGSQQRPNAPQARPNGYARERPMDRPEAGAPRPIRSDRAQPDGARPRPPQRAQDGERRAPPQRRERDEERVQP